MYQIFTSQISKAKEENVAKLVGLGGGALTLRTNKEITSILHYELDEFLIAGNVVDL